MFIITLLDETQYVSKGGYEVFEDDTIEGYWVIPVEDLPHFDPYSTSFTYLPTTDERIKSINTY